MPYRKIVLVPGEIYHIFNRGVARVPIFFTNSDFLRFLDLIDYYRFGNTNLSFSHFKKLASEERERIIEELRKENKLQVEIIAFCLLDNHYHLLLKQVTTQGIKKFISNLQNGYAKYFNIKTKRSGPLFQPMFKSVRMENDEQLLHVSRYIHLNPSSGYIVEINELESYPWSSLICYFEKSNKYPFVKTSIISGVMRKGKYKEFVYNQADYQRELNKIKHLLLE